ncbi:uncharacterized protein RAG0_02243 [Rhynchosporium agropyri]|uniref:Uncharacterized protein n=1 Tax=Rhynchosporium agropyri TaxID=914238 RepID=A0A1E1K1G9_9HELO|nr:uncharacterized protein RAG0_02243 [Rhynchosporium agropyri]
MLPKMLLIVAAIGHLVVAQTSKESSIWVTEVPTYVRPYAIQHYYAQAYIIGQRIYRFPVTRPSSDYAFALTSTNAPGSPDLGVFPQHKFSMRIFQTFVVGFSFGLRKMGSRRRES